MPFQLFRFYLNRFKEGSQNEKISDCCCSVLFGFGCLWRQSC
ncbi:hypothetical protein NEIMUCOT_05299 [Neisseria mucosa ATCC 25996]|uniref:Uncharacterized protein n=1 Tax=Neisseria mucosa (strain ATCC 25996 / DSM 4631 / NCTC 10774 / M26) TaxID=546266 RepID=D2ZXE6_NEIM2|nr:hypothetical protein NEIMUCOT_05299 [Neisseria mucosa ATCC 25996]